MKNKNWWLILVLLIIIFVIWEFWPEEMVDRSFSYDNENSLDLLDACIENSGISSATWELSYPQKVELNSESIVMLRLTPALSEGVDVSSMCTDIIIAANLEIPDAVIQPGEKIYAAFEVLQPLEISWRVFTNASEVNGKLWIYALPGETRDLNNHIPLFAIPIHIEVISFFGLEPRLIRIAGLAGGCIFLLLFAFVYQHQSE